MLPLTKPFYSSRCNLSVAVDVDDATAKFKTVVVKFFVVPLQKNLLSDEIEESKAKNNKTWLCRILPCVVCFCSFGFRRIHSKINPQLGSYSGNKNKVCAFHADPFFMMWDGKLMRRQIGNRHEFS